MTTNLSRKFARMHQLILILDFGSQVTQLIARRLREHNVYCEIKPWNKVTEIPENCVGVILSGSPFSVHQENAPLPEVFQLNPFLYNQEEHFVVYSDLPFPPKIAKYRLYCNSKSDLLS